MACSHSNVNKTNFDQENPKLVQKNQDYSGINSSPDFENLNKIVSNKPNKSQIAVNAIQTDSKDTDLATNNDNDKKPSKTNIEAGIFNEINSIWTNRNENTASDTSQKQNKNHSDNFINSFKKLFKS